MGRKHVLLLATLCSWSVGSAARPALVLSSNKRSISSSNKKSMTISDEFLVLRGGASSSSSKGKTKKKSKKSSGTGTAKKAIDDAMKEKDSAEALGDAIRDRADVLRKDDPLLQSIDWSISSLGHAMGASDHRMKLMSEGGGVEPATTSVVANYFLKSHGGAHGFQFLCSFLATLSGVGCLFFHKMPLGVTLFQRTMIFAMMKHVSGVLAGASIAAKAVPKIGLTSARQWMEQLTLDPISQYVFYTALLLLWTSKNNSSWWLQKSPIFPLIMVGPVLAREIVSNTMVVSDILVLLSVSTESSLTAVIQSILKISNSIINAVMSLLVSPKVWRNADPSKKQGILAKLVSQVSLGMELVVGLLLVADMIKSLVMGLFAGKTHRPSFQSAVTKLLCVRLYLHFLWVRRKKISQLTVNVRGGASKVPFWLFHILEHPMQSMGLLDDDDETEKDKSTATAVTNDTSASWTWKEYTAIALGLDQ